MRAHPFLRSPPFPGVEPAIAAISRPLDNGQSCTPVTDDDIDAILAARVGGAFWGRPTENAGLVVREGVAVNDATMRDAGSAGVTIVPLPDNGQRSPTSDYDLWQLVAQSKAVHAQADDELALIAGLLEVPVIGSDGDVLDPATLRAELRNALGQASYRDCFSGAPVDLSTAIGQLADWRRHIHGNRDIVAASGMAHWKRAAISQFLWNGEQSPPFMSVQKGLAQAALKRGALAVWPSRVPPSIVQEAASCNVPLIQVEDGFLRSRGLGAGLHPPGSVVVDRSGIYYDAQRTSDLETLLSTHAFPATLIERATRLRQRICATGVTKYGSADGDMIHLPNGRRTILAVGQVDDDLSVQLGGAGVKGNLDFLAQVRRVEPDAWIIYRPHPDVQAGHRKGHLSNAAILAHADTIDVGAPLMDLVQKVDEIHVLSSLTGFEALIRGCAVTVHGMPFYAGWGLTRDLAEVSGRRGRQLSVDQLLAAALILYPRYVDPVTQLPCGPEVMVERMASGMAPKKSWMIKMRTVQGKLRRLMTLTADHLHA